MQMRQLEDAVGLPLFEQLGKKVFLTEAGRELQHYSRNISQQLSEAAAVFDQGNKELQHHRFDMNLVAVPVQPPSLGVHQEVIKTINAMLAHYPSLFAESRAARSSAIRYQV